MTLRLHVILDRSRESYVFLSPALSWTSSTVVILIITPVKISPLATAYRYWPDPADDGPVLATDAPKHKWLGHKQAVTMEILKLQIDADQAAGFDYTGYHAYARRRYFELHDPDVESICEGVPEPYNTTCSYRGLTDIELRPDRNVTNWFAGCGCFMARHFAGRR